MNEPARPANPHRRDSAIRRLRSLTTGTAVAGIVGTGAFGALAAVSYSGQPATSLSDTQTETQPQSQVEQPENESVNDDNDTPSFVQVAPPQTTTRTTRRAHVSTGSS